MSWSRVAVVIGLATLLSTLGARTATSVQGETAWRAYERGDYATAAKLHAEQARKGDRLAQFNYAMMLFRREAAETERGEALQWLRRAADAGMMQAQYNMGLLYENGTAVPSRSPRRRPGSNAQPSRDTLTPK
jgi:TPR repeat protein